MAISERTIQKKRNSAGKLTGKPGTVYDVNIKYTSNGKPKTYVKKGLRTKAEAIQHEAEMKLKLSSPTYVPPTAAQRKETVREYMTDWLERHGEANLRPNTKASYESSMRSHIFPCIGDVPLSRLSAAMLDDMYRKMFEKGLSASTVKYAHRIMGVALEHARKYHYIETNPARDTITKFGPQNKTPDPYTVEQVAELLRLTEGTQWHLLIVLGALYGLRLSECLGLRWKNVDLDHRTMAIVEQLPPLQPGTYDISEFAPVKSSERTLPITEQTLRFFQARMEEQKLQKQERQDYHDNDLILARPNGIPLHRERVSSDFKTLLQRIGMPHIRFHDLRHSAATNMHEVTGDFFTVGQILGHSLKGIGIQLGVSSSLEAATAQYVNVRLDRKLVVLTAYHEAVFK